LTIDHFDVISINDTSKQLKAPEAQFSLAETLHKPNQQLQNALDLTNLVVKPKTLEDVIALKSLNESLKEFL